MSGRDTPPQQSLSVTDNRTGKTITIPIKNNAIPATAFKQLKASRYACFENVDTEEDDTENGIRVLDPSFDNTAAITSTITFIDGNKGILRYRGYPIEELAAKSNFLEVSYLLIYGELPTAGRLETWTTEIMNHTFVHRDVEDLFSAFRYDAHPVAQLATGFAALGAYAPEANPSLQGQDLYTRGAHGDVSSLSMLDKQIVRIIGKAPTLGALAYRIRSGRPFNRPPQGLSYCGSYLYLMDHLSEREYQPSPVLEKALDILFLLHADHEMNCSTATVLSSSSSLVDPYSAVAAGVTALYGPRHGGACEACLRMLMEIGSPANVPKFIEEVKAKKRKLVGFGHRIYKTTDPRAKIIRQLADEVFKVTGPSPLLDTALALKEAAESDDYFKSRSLLPNVDFFSGLIYTQMGFPLDFFPVLFVLPRTVGWLAHMRQQILDPKSRIWRPRQVYVGSGLREYVPVAERREPREGLPLHSAPVALVHGKDASRRKLATFKDETGKEHAGSKL
ncbi:hypothetical protein CF319_g2351 [Tilletia indica]|uniref:Citrate synthase n=2 Tax=Tilletia TaxID=13289 RepID=A0A8X7T2L6_9BASI|nr:hypothetical protein CF327_g6304 [Tilletia walkeri]KAE8224814.1 hypothetical protein CF319_g2351 [Tilletia indica]KAE8228868.1 hypothetical protein CF326_g6181 [Tilletia indica]KAE8259977.1 hypothetical protein A4X13_0g628 [Tilletia indica]KAE8266381.1 hypothetical protein A4X09_0g5963 [Tilletia walkeri]